MSLSITMKCIKRICTPNKIAMQENNPVILTVIPDNDATTSKKNEPMHYPCLCETIRIVMLLCRCSALMPINSVDSKPHSNGCRFVLSKPWFIYACIVLAFFLPYYIFMYTQRLICGPRMSTLNSLEWYVMTFGYIITDIESIVVILTGLIYAKSTCKFFEELSLINGSLNEMIFLQKTINRTMKYWMPGVLLVFMSYTYVAWLRLNKYFGNYYCTLLDQPFAVMVRGITIILPTMEVTIIICITSIVAIKYKNLADATELALHITNATQNATSLEKISRTHREITSSVKKMNKIFGIQMLMGITSSIYTTIYYLYRFCTATETKKYTLSSIDERSHYIFALAYRSTKLAIFMFLGHKLGVSSLQPLEVLQKSEILTLPQNIRDQVQILLILWQGKRATLSGIHVVNIGPWLLAPIVGNVITYLLVALQFKNQNLETPQNMTFYFESLF